MGPSSTRESDFADLLDSLTPEQQVGKTLCEGWTPLDVAGHLVSFVELSLPSMMLSMAKAGFNADKAWKVNATKYKAMGAEAISASLRANGSKTAPMKSFSSGIVVNDVCVHTQDVRRGLGLSGELNADALRHALDYCTAHKQAKIHVPPKHIADLRLEATDIDWSWGSGKLVSGPAQAILLGINRRDMSSELTCDGVADLPR